LWTALGFGIMYEEWKTSGFSFDILEKFHQNLIKAQQMDKNYTASYLTKRFG